MTGSRRDKPVFRLEVTRKDIFIRALRPTRRTVILTVLALLLLGLAGIAIARPELRGACLEAALALVELVLGAPGSER